MASIGNATCTDVRGEIPPLAMRSDVWTVPGLHGYGILLLGRGDSEFRLTCVLFSSASGAKAWEANLKALQGQFVTIITGYGSTHPNCFLRKVGNLRRQAAYHPGTAITTRAEIEIEGFVAG